MIELTHQPIDTNLLLNAVSNPRAGAVVLFVGVTREFTDGRQTQHLDYECYPKMAQSKLEELVETAQTRWDVCDIALVHRLGRVDLEEASVAIAVSSPHRKVAFEAGEWLIDTLKEVVPIWKCENWVDGTTEWVHPGLEPTEIPPGIPPGTPPGTPPGSLLDNRSGDGTSVSSAAKSTQLGEGLK